MSLRMTEQLHDRAMGLDALDGGAALTILLDAQIAAAGAARAALPAIEAGADAMARAVSAGGRLVYAAAGSSGLMGMADGLELPGTFGLARERVRILLAGGAASLADLTGDVEDDVEAARADAAVIGAKDCVICLSASGSTPYPLAVQAAARDTGAACVAIANTPDSPLLQGGDIAICLPTPPEVIAGSTRLGAGTAQKIALNMMSTLMGLRLGHVHDGRMVNLFADNGKLRDRAERIVVAVAGCARAEAAEALARADGSAKLAILIARGAGDAAAAARLLDRAGQRLRPALADLRAGAQPNDRPPRDIQESSE